MLVLLAALPRSHLQRVECLMFGLRFADLTNPAVFGFSLHKVVCCGIPREIMELRVPCWCHPKWNPCPCGYHGDPKRKCRCSPRQIEQYRQRISGPRMQISARAHDRILKVARTIADLAACETVARQWRGGIETTLSEGGMPLRRARNHEPKSRQTEGACKIARAWRMPCAMAPICR